MTEEEHRGISVRVLVVALVIQFVLMGAAVYFALEGWPFVGGGRNADPAPARSSGRPAAAPAVPSARVDRFDARRAYATASRLVALGPRPAGSGGARAAAAMLRPLLPGGRFEPIRGHRALRNLIVRTGGAGRPIVLIAHYDTTPVDGYVGANNSAAAVGAVVEIARRLHETAAPANAAPVVFLLTDGEEAPDYPPRDFSATGLRGSKAAAAGVLGRTARAVIVLDFVGQRGLRIPREENSDERLWSRLRGAAEAVGVGAVFPQATRGAILDDHVPFRDRGVPAIDLIDFDYACWQRTCDTLDKLSVRSIDAAGEAVTELVGRLR